MDGRWQWILPLAVLPLPALFFLREGAGASVPAWLPFVAVGGAVALIAIAVAVLRSRKRTRDIEALSRSLGMAYFRRHEDLAAEPYTALPLFGRGRRQRGANLLRGGSELIFDFRYTTGSGKNSSTHCQTVALTSDSRRTLPRFALKPEGLLDRIGAAFGGQDIDFEEDPDFSRRFRLRGEDEEALRKLFQAAVRQDLTQRTGLSMEGNGEWLVVYRHRRLVPADRLFQFLEDARRISSMLRHG
jgi:hypothetical protein